MPSTLIAKNVVQHGNCLTLNLTFNDQNRELGSQNPYTGVRNPDPSVSLITPEYLINCLVAFQARVVRYDKNVLYFVRFVLKRDINQLSYTVKYSHRINDPAKSSPHECCITNEQWHLVTELKNGDLCTFYISINLSISTWVNPFERIYNDTELTDFELRGKDGSVSFHKAVAASFSPVIKTGFSGEWGKDGKRVIDAPPGTTRQTLQHLKDYMYSDKIPVSGLKQLLLLASYFIMPDLELRCVLDMLTNVTSEDAYDLFEFGMKHQMSQLIFEIMHRVENGMLSADAIRKHQKW